LEVNKMRAERLFSGMILIAVLAILSVAVIAYAEENETEGAANSSAANVTAGKTVRALQRQALLDKLEQERQQVREARNAEVQARQEARNTQNTVRETLREKRELIVQDREQLNTCKGSNSTDCSGLRVQVKGDAVDFMKKSAEKIQETLDQLKEKVESSNATDKDALLSQITAAMDKLAAAKAKVDALSGNSTQAEIRDANKDLKDAWQETRKVLRVGVVKASSARLGNVIAKAETLSERLDTAIANAKAKNKDIGSLAALVAQFKANIAAAKAANADVSSLADQGKVPEAAQKMQESQKALREARQNLLQITKELRTLKEATPAATQ
jgi:hypothetical protein